MSIRALLRRRKSVYTYFSGAGKVILNISQASGAGEVYLNTSPAPKKYFYTYTYPNLSGAGEAWEVFN